MILIINALLLTALAIFLLYTSWNKRASHPYFKLLAFLFLLAALYCWCSAHGIEFGPVYWLICTSITACFFIVFNASHRPDITPIKPTQYQVISWQQTGSVLKKVIIAGPLAALASICVVLSLIPILPGDKASQLVTAALLLPLCWAIAIFWACATQKQIQPIFCFIAIIALSNFYL